MGCARKKVIDSGRTRLNQLHVVISNKSINLSACRMLLLAVVRPSLEYGNEIGKCIGVHFTGVC